MWPRSRDLARWRPCRPIPGWWPACSLAAVTTQVKGRLADQLQAALEHRWLTEQAKAVIMGREELDAQAAFERLRRAARSSARRLADVAKDVTAGQPLPPAGVTGPGPGPGRPRTTRPPPI